jgi:hypothetical protein
MFYEQAKVYYYEAAGAIKAPGFAHLLLACNVRLPPLKSTVPGTNLEWEDLVKRSIVFPYYLSQNRKSEQPESYYFPPLFWIDCAVLWFFVFLFFHSLPFLSDSKIFF